MPKAGSKKSGGKRVAAKSDFAKVRHKVGRKLPQATNVTNTSVKAKRIVLPGQTLGADRSERALTSRGLAIEEVLAQVTHYSARMRREALQSLRELLGDHPWLLSLHAARVFGALAPRLADEDREARSALRLLLREAVLPALPPPALAPFVPLLALHTAGAMTHMDPGVRRDALSALELLLGACPGAVCAGAPAAMLRHFRDLLAGGPGGVRWSPAPLGAAVGALQALLQALVAHLRSLAPGASAAEGDQGGDAQPPWVWQPGALPAAPLQWRRAWGVTAGEAAAQAQAEPPEDCATACAALAPRLLNVWGQLAPGLMEPGGADAASLGCLLGVLRCCALASAVCRAAATASSPSRAAAARLAEADGAMRCAHAELLASLGRHFPVQSSAAPPSPEGRAAVGELNLATAALLLLPEYGFATAAPAGALHARVAAHIAALLSHLAAARAPGAAAAADDDISGGGASHAQLLPLAVGALRHPATQQAERALLLAALSALWDAAPPRSAQKAATLLVLRGLLLAPALVPADTAARWLASLPRLLFDLRHGQPEASLLALRTLQDAARCASPGSPAAAALSALEPELAPLFAAAALALLASLPALSAPTLRCVALAALSPGDERGVASLCADAVAAAPGAALPLRVGWMATLLLGQDAQGARGLAPPAAPGDAPGPAGGLTWLQRADVVAAACCGLAALAPGLDVGPWAPLRALWPAACQSEALQHARVPRHVAFAFLCAAADAAAAAPAADEPPPPELDAPLQRLLVDYLVAAAEEGVLAAPPQALAPSADENEPGIMPATRLIIACAPLLAGVATALASLARTLPAAAPHCLTALAALVARADMHGPLLRSREAVRAAAAELTAAEGLEPQAAAVARHLREALKQL